MNTFTMKTYRDSYLYNNKVSKRDPSDPKKNTDKQLLDFITNSHRIEAKTSDAFRGVLEELKRQQRSSILLTVLLMDKVKICIGTSELPRAFKVFEAKDSKSNYAPMVFIDATGLIEFKDGYYYCKKIDVLCAYLMDALVYLLYRYYPAKIIENSNITQTATSCYVSMFDYIIDYLRIIGFASNKNKISYLAGLFFLNNMMGKPIDQYTKQIAGNIAGITAQEINTYDLYLEDGIFDNIDIFVNYIADTFRLKDFTLEVFVSKWMYLYGTGTQYACELYTSFLCLISNAYSGSYIVNQKQIERCCGSNIMAKLWNAVEKAGISAFDLRSFMRESDLKLYEVHDKNTRELSESLAMQKNVPASMIIEGSDFMSSELIKEKAEDIVDYYKKARMTDKLASVAEKAYMEGIAFLYHDRMSSIKEGTDSNYDDGSLIQIAKVFKNQLNDRQRYNLESTINRDIESMKDCLMVNEAGKDLGRLVSKSISELREMQQYV